MVSQIGTKNPAQQDLRMIKLQVEVSGGWRTLNGDRYFCHIWSFISTTRKQRYAELENLVEPVSGDAGPPQPREWLHSDKVD